MSKIVLETDTSRATPSPVPGKRMTAPAILARKKDGVTAEPLVMLTAYTMRMAQLLDPHCEMLLVGDSLGQVIYGLPSTLPVTLEMMCAHGAAVVRGSWHALVAVDMPFGSYEGSPAASVRLGQPDPRQETGAAAVKLEGGEAMAPTIDFLIKRGIPVIGHVGLTPQAVNTLGGYGARGKSDAEATKILGDASAVADAGAFCIVIEGVMEGLADEVTQRRPHPHHRHWRLEELRRASAGDRGHARAVRAHPALREALPRPRAPRSAPRPRNIARRCGRAPSPPTSRSTGPRVPADGLDRLRPALVQIVVRPGEAISIDELVLAVRNHRLAAPEARLQPAVRRQQLLARGNLIIIRACFRHAQPNALTQFRFNDPKHMEVKKFMASA